ncbi:hypothetical protein GCM10025857_36650 [Alicyclobacillus contaminans]|nr:hypothetical protein GCM10025857_36650 [Alicyclobacillus contaminans]
MSKRGMQDAGQLLETVDEARGRSAVQSFREDEHLTRSKRWYGIPAGSMKEFVDGNLMLGDACPHSQHPVRLGSQYATSVVLDLVTVFGGEDVLCTRVDAQFRQPIVPGR